MWECRKCGEEVEDDFDVCWNCQAGRDGSLPESSVTPTEDKVKPEKKIKATSSPEVTSLMNRYKDAYLIARATNGWGKLIKIFGLVMAVILVLLGLMFIADGDKTGQLMGAILVVLSIIEGVWSYIIGVLVSAQGQILKASLDGAVNGSPFLTNENRAKIMSL